MPSAASSRLLAVAMLALALGACANTGAGRAGDDIVWETERVAPSGTQTATAPATSTAPTTDDGCREYTQTVNIGGEEQKAYGRVCPQPDGSWRFEPPPSQQRPGSSLEAARTAPVYPYPAMGSSMFFGSAFYFGKHHHHHHRHHRHHWHRRPYR
jgi:hypothetical protein